jgi:hypothetical protein
MTESREEKQDRTHFSRARKAVAQVVVALARHVIVEALLDFLSS